MVSTFVLRPAPVGDAATMVSLYTKKQSGECCSNFSYPQFEDIRDQMRSFSSVSAYFPLLPASIGGRGEPERVWGQLVSANYFQTAQLKMTVVAITHMFVEPSSCWMRSSSCSRGSSVIGQGASTQR